MKDETRFQIKFLKLLRALPKSWIVKISQRSISGTPDVIGCVNGKFIAVELKATPKSPLSHLQEYEINRINSANGRAYLCHPENMKEVLEDIKSLTK